jgi:hypothetical protein
VLDAGPLVPVGLAGLDAAAWLSTNLASLAPVAPVVPVAAVVPAGARWMHPVTVMVVAELELPVCGVVCAARPTDRIMAAAANATDRTMVLVLPILFLMLSPLFR